MNDDTDPPVSIVGTVAIIVGMLVTGCARLDPAHPVRSAFLTTYYGYASGEEAELFYDPSTPTDRRQTLWQKNLHGDKLDGDGVSWRVGMLQREVLKEHGPPIQTVKSPIAIYDERWEYPLWYFYLKDGLLRHVELTHHGKAPELLQRYEVLNK